MYYVLIVSLLIYSYFDYNIHCTEDADNIFHVALNGDNTLQLHWMPDYESNHVIFEIHSPPITGWLAIGLSDRGDFFNADYCILWQDLKRKTHFQDAWSDEKGIIHLDYQQDCTNFEIRKWRSITKYTYQKKFDTCDEQDYYIDDGTVHIVWVRGEKPLYSLEQLNITAQTQKENRGMIRIQLLKNINVSNKMPEHVYTIEVTANSVNVPPVETTYWCVIHKLDAKIKEKHHIYMNEPSISKGSEGVVHHMEVFHCEVPGNIEIPMYNGDCFSPSRPDITHNCKKVLAAWAMGASNFVFPDEAGLPFGGPDYNQYVMLELHYNNPELIAGIVDSSGIRMHVSTTLKKSNAAIMELGLEYVDKMAIPPKQDHFQLSGYCISECTAVGLPLEGINVFGSQLHTHLTGVQVITRHFRDGVEMLELNKDLHYSPHFQEIRRLKRIVHIIPGDALITQCTYNTKDRPNITLGGFGTHDEMCVNYIYYYPATDLEVCKSSISDQALETYFTYMNDWEGQDVSINNGISENYHNIEWNRMRVQLLKEVYHESPLSMQCNRSSGIRFPGYWENAKITPILQVLPPPAREC